MSSFRLTARIVALAMGVALCGPLTKSLAAQASVDLTPFAGAYVPTADLSNLGTSVKNKTSLAVGTRLTFWGAGRLGVEGTFAFAPSKLTSPPGGSVNVNARVVTGSASLLLGILPAGSTSALFLRAGPAVIARGGDAFNNISNKTKWGGVVGAGVRVPLGSVGLRVDAEDYLYNGKFGSNGRSSFQNDLMFTAGLAIRLGGK
jgi:hypothetical protein